MFDDEGINYLIIGSKGTAPAFALTLEITKTLSNHIDWTTQSGLNPHFTQIPPRSAH